MAGAPPTIYRWGFSGKALDNFMAETKTTREVDQGVRFKYATDPAKQPPAFRPRVATPGQDMGPYQMRDALWAGFLKSLGGASD